MFPFKYCVVVFEDGHRRDYKVFQVAEKAVQLMDFLNQTNPDAHARVEREKYGTERSAWECRGIYFPSLENARTRSYKTRQDAYNGMKLLRRLYPTVVWGVYRKNPTTGDRWLLERSGPDGNEWTWTRLNRYGRPVGEPKRSWQIKK